MVGAVHDKVAFKATFVALLAGSKLVAQFGADAEVNDQIVQLDALPLSLYGVTLQKYCVEGNKIPLPIL